MRKLILTAVVLMTALPNACEGSPTLICWSDWVVRSSEALYYGRKHSSFPLTHLFDGNPATAWVFSGTGRHVEDDEAGFVIEMERGRFRKSIPVDGIWIMNGYNKSRELFLRNNRIVGLKVYLDGKFVKTVGCRTRWAGTRYPYHDGP